MEARQDAEETSNANSSLFNLPGVTATTYSTYVEHDKGIKLDLIFRYIYLCIALVGLALTLPVFTAIAVR